MAFDSLIGIFGLLVTDRCDRIHLYKYIYSFGGNNMKKIFKNLTIAAVAVASLVTLTPNDKAEAATTGWQTLWGNCKVRIWVDAYTYTKGATTIDFL
ncbi:hypothetical protein ACT453_08255 [Bacillus sp. D-CC]